MQHHARSLAAVGSGRVYPKADRCPTGLSDWADGYTAKHWGQSSVLGSYLDPLADKVLVCCTVGALAAEVTTVPQLFFSMLT